jgi:ribosome maturation factor RimP
LFLQPFYRGPRMHGNEEAWVRQTRDLASVLVKDSFLELFDLTVRRQGGRCVVSVVLDKADGTVTLTDCEAVSLDLEKRLDEMDVVPVPYVLEVSSPGMDRPLRSWADCQRFLGRKAHLVTKENIDSQVSFEGRLEAVEGDVVMVRVGAERVVSIPWGMVRRANLVVEL